MSSQEVEWSYTDYQDTAPLYPGTSERGAWETEIPHEYMPKWQGTVDLLSKALQIPIAVITRYRKPYIEVLRTTAAQENPYYAGLRAEISGHFCEQVVRSGSRLRVSYAPAERRWQNAPELEDGLVSYLGYPLRWPDGTVFGTLCILDTTRREFGSLCDEMLQKLQELIEEDLLLIVRNRELNEALSQRELLLREVRHRIKNSLNHIYSLVSLWGMQSSSEEVHSLTEMVQKRLASIGMLYSHLEMSEGSPSIRFDHYLRGVLDHIRGLYESDIRIELSAEALEITPDGAMYLGLLTAEIVTNSFKYAFPDPQEGRITLHLSRDGGHLWYRVADNGVGIEPDAMRESESSDEHMGLSLVYSIVRRLQGRVRLAGGEGTEWCFCIPLEKLQG